MSGPNFSNGWEHYSTLKKGRAVDLWSCIYFNLYFHIDVLCGLNFSYITLEWIYVVICLMVCNFENSFYISNCSTPNPISKLLVWGEHYNCHDTYYSTTWPGMHFCRKKFINGPSLKILTSNFQDKVFEI